MNLFESSDQGTSDESSVVYYTYNAVTRINAMVFTTACTLRIAMTLTAVRALQPEVELLIRHLEGGRVDQVGVLNLLSSGGKGVNNLAGRTHV